MEKLSFFYGSYSLPFWLRALGNWTSKLCKKFPNMEAVGWLSFVPFVVKVLGFSLDFLAIPAVLAIPLRG